MVFDSKRKHAAGGGGQQNGEIQLVRGGGGTLRQEIFAMGYFEAGLFRMQS